MTTQKIEIAQHTSPAGGPAAIQRALAEFPLSELPQAIVSFGGQSILVYEIHQRQIQSSHTFNKCGSGTGEFLVQQVKRLGFRDLQEAAAEAARALAQGQSPYVPASRCSVFCKSDCTHACNKRKATMGQIAAGLFHMVGSKIMELLEKTDATRVWLTGSGSGIEPVAEWVLKRCNELIRTLESCNQKPNRLRIDPAHIFPSSGRNRLRRVASPAGPACLRSRSQPLRSIPTEIL